MEHPELVATPVGVTLDTRAAMWLAVVGVLAVSCSAILVRVAVAPALAIAWWRCAGGTVALLPFAARAGVRPTARQRRSLIVAGACLALHFALFIGSLRFTTVASAVVLTATVPVWAGIGSALFLHQPPSRRTWSGIGLALVGAIVVGLADAGSAAAQAAPNPLLGDVMAVACAVAVTGLLPARPGRAGHACRSPSTASGCTAARRCCCSRPAS